MQKNTDFFQSYEAMEQEIEVLDREQTLRIEIDSGLETALRELEDLKSQMPKEQAQNLLELCETNVINTIKRQFGASALFNTSKEGGQVSTTHNARENIYGINEEKERLAYENVKRVGYDSYKVHSDKDYIAINKEQTNLKKQGGAVDYMTGEKFKPNAEVNLDHKISAKEIYDDPARVLAEVDTNKLANTKDNLALTDASLNKMKGAKSPEQFIKDKHETLKKFQIKQEKGTLTPNEEKKMQKLKSIDDEKFLAEAKESKRKIDRKVDIEYYTSSKPYKELATSIGIDVKNIAKGGLKSALAIVIARLVKELFAEIRHIFKHFGDESFSEIFARLKERLSKVISEIKQDFKGIFEGSIEQIIGAVLSNIVLFVVNIVKSTFTNLTRIIRAGFGSLIKAIKILANPPANMPKDEVAFEALKVFTAGIITAGSLFLEKGIKDFIVLCPFLAAAPAVVTDFIATTLSALIGGVLSTIVLYYMDKAFNGAKKSRLQLQIMTKSGEVVSYKIAQSYFVLKDSYEYLADTAQRYEDKITGIRQFLADSGKEADSALDELAMTLKDLENKGV